MNFSEYRQWFSIEAIAAYDRLRIDEGDHMATAIWRLVTALPPDLAKSIRLSKNLIPLTSALAENSSPIEAVFMKLKWLDWSHHSQLSKPETLRLASTYFRLYGSIPKELISVCLDLQDLKNESAWSMDKFNDFLKISLLESVNSAWDNVPNNTRYGFSVFPYLNLATTYFENSNSSCHSFLDIGCGTGLDLIDIAQCFSNAQGVGVDSSQNMATRATSNIKTARLDNRITIQLGEFTTLAHNSPGAFNLALSKLVMSYNFDPIGYLRDLRSVLCSNGIAILVDFYVDDDLDPSLQQLTSQFITHTQRCAISPLGLKSLTALLEYSNFEILELSTVSVGLTRNGNLNDREYWNNRYEQWRNWYTKKVSSDAELLKRAPQNPKFPVFVGIIKAKS